MVVAGAVGAHYRREGFRRRGRPTTTGMPSKQRSLFNTHPDPWEWDDQPLLPVASVVFAEGVEEAYDYCIPAPLQADVVAGKRRTVFRDSVRSLPRIVGGECGRQCLSDDGRIFSVCEFNHLQVWDVQSGRLLMERDLTTEGLGGSSTSIMTPDGSRITEPDR